MMYLIKTTHLVFDLCGEQRRISLPVLSNDISNGERGFETLFDIEITWWFVEHEDVTFLNTNHRTSESLKFTTGEIFDLSISDVRQVEQVNDFLLIAQFVFLTQKISDSTLKRWPRRSRCRSIFAEDVYLCSSRNLIHVLRFEDRFKILFENLRKVILQFTSPEELQDVLPIGRCLESVNRCIQRTSNARLYRIFAQVRLEFARQDT